MVARRSYLRSGPGEIPASDLLRPRGATEKALHCYRGQSPAAGSGRRSRRSGCRRRATYHLRADPCSVHPPTGAPYDGYLPATRLRSPLADFQKHRPAWTMAGWLCLGSTVKTLRSTGRLLPFTPLGRS